jgi:hypothetical protein
MVVTKSQLLRAALMDACQYAPPVGSLVDDMTQQQLLFCEETGIVTQNEVLHEVGRLDLPLSMIATSGSCNCAVDGSGYGCELGAGDGAGFGSGGPTRHGYGYWDADGSGTGFGDMDGYGYADYQGGGACRVFPLNGEG